MDYSFYKNKKVLVTGHTGFKGTWLCKMLLMAGANVVGYALEPNVESSLFELTSMKSYIKNIYGDICDYEKLKEVFEREKPEIVFHLAAQPLVRESYKNPRETYEVNVMGTVNLLECIRKTDCVKSFLNITTDKVYHNREWIWGYREEDSLDGFDPYSNSKSCSELVTASYQRSFFAHRQIAISTVRAGNVIGGGDFATDRIIPDCVRAASVKRPIRIRNPHSIRPYQHVIEPLNAYMMIAKEQYKDYSLEGNYNVGPKEEDCVTTGKLVTLFCEKWGDNQTYICETEKDAPHEANYLRLDCSKIKSVFRWSPRWNIEQAVEMVTIFSKYMLQGKDVSEEMEREIVNYWKE